MRFIFLLLCLASPSLVLAATDARVLRAGDTTLRVEVVDVDDAARAALLHRWIDEAARAAMTASGRFPLREARVRIEQIDSDDPSPVPWGQTARRGDVAVLLYVRRGATLDELRADWTAAHELAHLFHPSLGARGRWLAEGLASYHQNVFRARAGLLDANEAWRRLDAGFRRGEAATAPGRLDALGHRGGGTMRVYWAGALYWLEADLALRARGSSLDAVLDGYARCCLRGTDAVEPRAFAAALDRIAGGDVLVPLYERYASSNVFPSLDHAYGQLGIERDGKGLRFTQARDDAALRRSIMAPRAER